MTTPVQLIKLITGQEIIAFIEDNTADVLTLGSPTGLAPFEMGQGQLGLKFIPFIYSADLTLFKLYRTQMMGDPFDPDPQLETSYRSHVSGLQIVSSMPSGIISSPLMG